MSYCCGCVVCGVSDYFIFCVLVVRLSSCSVISCYFDEYLWSLWSAFLLGAHVRLWVLYSVMLFLLSLPCGLTFYCGFFGNDRVLFFSG